MLLSTSLPCRHHRCSSYRNLPPWQPQHCKPAGLQAPCLHAAGLKPMTHAMHARTARLVRAAASTMDVDLTALYTSQLCTPPRIMADVSAEVIPGRGVGIRAKRDIKPGELLMCVPALAVTFGPRGNPPENEELVQGIARQVLSPEQVRWLQLLHIDRGPLSSHSSSSSSSGSSSNANDSSSSSTATAAAVGLSLEQQAAELNSLLHGTWQQSISSPATGSDASPVAGSLASPNATDIEDPTASPGHAGDARDSAMQPEGVYMLGITSSNASSSAAAAAQLKPSTLLQPGGLALQNGQRNLAWITEAVACNTVADVCEDVAAGELREMEPLQAFNGLWPEFALVNHSCMPNTVHIVVGRHLLLRATRTILEGQELTTGYLAAQRFEHVAARRLVLRQSYGFHCRCTRCVLEQRYFPTVRYAAALERGSGTEDMADIIPGKGPLQWLLDRVFGESRFLTGTARNPALLASLNKLLETELEVEAQAALSAMNKVNERRAALFGQLQRAIEAVEQGVAEVAGSGGLEERYKLALKASVYNLYRLAYEMADLVPDLLDSEAQAALLRQLLRVCDAVARGTDTHLFLACRYVQRARVAYGPQSPEAREAQLLCATAHISRYGPVSQVLLQQLVAVRQRQALGASLGQRLGVLAWDLGQASSSGVP